MDYFSRKSLSKYLMNNIKFNKHDVDIFINGTWQKYAGNIGRLVGKQVLLRISDIRNRFRCVCFLQFDWLIFLGNYYHVGFKKGREAGLMLEGELRPLSRGSIFI
jgi:hypothetical protein